MKFLLILVVLAVVFEAYAQDDLVGKVKKAVGDATTTVGDVVDGVKGTAGDVVANIKALLEGLLQGPNVKTKLANLLNGAQNTIKNLAADVGKVADVTTNNAATTANAVIDIVTPK